MPRLRRDERIVDRDMDRELTLRASSPTEVTSPCRQRQKQKVQKQLSEEGSMLVEDLVPISPELANWIKLNSKGLKIRKKDRQWASEVVNDFRENLLKFLRSCTKEPFFQSAEFLNTGSYFEKVKIHSPDEFDMMLKLQSPARLDMKELDGGLFYQLDLNHQSRGPIQAFLLDNERTLSSSKILKTMYRLVRQFLKTYKVPDELCHWEVNRKRPTSPAVTLSLYKSEDVDEELMSLDLVPALEIHPSQGWPAVVRSGPDVKNWLGKKVRLEIKSLPCYFVPKRMKGRNISDEAKESWRISFSHIEKKMMTYHGNTKTCCESNATKCCRKSCLMLLKSLIEGLKQRFPKELDDLCSYHGKTAFLHTLSVRFDDSMWACEKLPGCFLYLLGDLEDHARRGSLPHFFVPDCNLFSPLVFPRRTLAFLVNALVEQKREGLPLLKPPAPVSPLKLRTSHSEDSSVLTEDQPTNSLLSHLNELPIFIVALVVVVFLMYVNK
ncbi:cyclic GMP-AMP synthase-like [Solea solea]|uniref:cyclic GMP-AMP synthase-like n=1 Tax=Solea solea TaxID=90069 RepID=UPI00272A3CF8|nr:cyclic GMP-AMP synthase-like [Solea solea]XP_058474462.1 cyclic GMP-AMP synthase-like [Solea solea]